MAEDRTKLRKDNPNTWIPVNPGDLIDGDAVEVVAAWSDVQDDFYPLLRIRVDQATGYTVPDKDELILAVHGFPVVLRDRLLSHQPAPGERLIITFEGIGESKTRGRNAPALYRVELPDRDPAETAAKVYSQLSRRRERAGDPEPDVPIAAEDLPAA